VYARATVVLTAAALDEAAADAHTPQRHPGRGEDSFTTPPSSVHPSLGGVDDGADDGDAEEAAFPDLLPEAARGGVESPQTMLDFPSLDTLPSMRHQLQQAEALSPQVAALLDSARLGGCKAGLVRLGVRTHLDLCDVTDDDLAMLGLSTLEIRRFIRLRLEAEAPSEAPAAASAVTDSGPAKQRVTAAHGCDDDSEHDDAVDGDAGDGPARAGSSAAHGDGHTSGTSCDQAVAPADEPGRSPQLPRETTRREAQSGTESLTERTHSSTLDSDAAEAAAAIEAAVAMRARLAAMMDDMDP
jgi:hypothetical protein